MCETNICKKCGVEKKSPEDFHYKNVCKGCYKVYDRLRRQTEKYKARERAYHQTPERKLYMRLRSQTPEQIAYRQTPEYKARHRACCQTPKGRATQRAYNQRPETKAKQRAHEQTESRKLKKSVYQKTQRYLEKNRAYRMEFGGGHHTRAERRGNYAERFKRTDIFKRDKFTCQYCKKRLILKDCVLDHRIPIAKGGSNTPENCATSCRACNSEKSAKIINGTQITIFDRVKD